MRRLLAGRHDREELADPGDLEELQHPGLGDHHPHGPPGPLDLLRRADQGAEPGGIDEAHAEDVHHQDRDAAADDRIQALTERRSAGDVDLTGHDDQHALIDGLLRDAQGIAHGSNDLVSWRPGVTNRRRERNGQKSNLAGPDQRSAILRQEVPMLPASPDRGSASTDRGSAPTDWGPASTDRGPASPDRGS